MGMTPPSAEVLRDGGLEGCSQFRSVERAGHPMLGEWHEHKLGGRKVTIFIGRLYVAFTELTFMILTLRAAQRSVP